MTIHKVTGGDGYDYLTGQVMSGDELRQRGQSPEDYYGRTGEQPGYWLGRGAPVLGLEGEVQSSRMRELWVAAAGRGTTRTAVAGFDLTFSPVKSVSALWAVAPPSVQQIIEASHRSAVAQTVAYMEGFAATRTGYGSAPDPAPGFVVAAFEHRTSRTGDPDLHTHAAVLNRAQSPDGKWRALMHPPLFHATVSASEHYNARLEDNLVRDLGVAFADRPRRDPTLRPTREIVGVPEDLLVAFSGRRQAIEARAAELAAERGLNPSRSVKADARLHQWATLDTRTRKPPQQSLAERVAGWRAVAEKVLGPGGVERMLEAVRQAVHVLDPRTLADVAKDIRARVKQDRREPGELHIRAESERQLRAHPAAIADRDPVVTTMTETVVKMTNPTVTPEQQKVLDYAALGARIRAARAPGPVQRALTAAGDYYRQQLPTSWVPEYLASRQLPATDAGYAPGRSALVTHLRGLGFTDDVIVKAGLARQTERGHLYDFFRDRMVLPLREPSGQVVGFTGRKPPTDVNPSNPKYMNSAESTVFHKREVVYGLTPDAVQRLRAGAPIMFVEGPTDVLAVDVSRETSVVPVAVCGTAITPDHLRALDEVAPLRDRPVFVVMDDDPAGRAAAVAAYAVMTEHGLTDLRTSRRVDVDPASMVQNGGPTALARALAEEVPLQDVVVDATLDKWPNPKGWVEPRVGALREVAPLIAAMPAEQRERQAGRVAEALGLPAEAVRGRIGSHVPAVVRLDLPAAPKLATAPAAKFSPAPPRTYERDRSVSY